MIKCKKPGVVDSPSKFIVVENLVQSVDRLEIGRNNHTSLALGNGEIRRHTAKYGNREKQTYKSHPGKTEKYGDILKNTEIGRNNHTVFHACAQIIIPYKSAQAYQGGHFPSTMDFRIEETSIKQNIL
ncbi:hypothetical protein DPMN_180542 [Dreissena polymorpha]|uniref:Uncharacterized protein n=1 Tax=Dreissena polymorpha TaxID=45954 RepID=A0A9D4EG60_DREPO|nr:hypothetical protein DPMN_180542 [Dreissena polymorpha]